MKRKIGVFGLITLLGLLAIFLFLGTSSWAQKKPPSPPPPPADPAIAYASGNASALKVMNADGSNKRVVYSEKGVSNLNPDWSPNGKQLVFTRYCLRGGCNGIYIVNVDGTGLRPVVNFNWEGSKTHRVAWSPVPLGDGKYKIAFVDKAWLPDGSLKADLDLFMINLDGSGLVQLTDTPGINEWEVEWSPLGDRIAIETYNPAAPPCDLVVYEIGYDYINDKFSAPLLGSVILPGSPLDTATDVTLNDWAKTQNKLVVEVLSPRPAATGYQLDLWTIDVTIPYSPVLFQLTFTLDQPEYSASWSPDDTKIAFLSAGYFWVMNSDGTGAKQITTANDCYFKGLNWRRNLYPN